MNSFGLGLVLSFTDNASSGMSRVSQTFNQMNGLASKMVDASNSAVFSIESLTAAGIGLGIVGEQLSSAGQAILGMFAGISQSVIDTGMTMQGFRMQLRALYGEDSYEQKIQEIKKYAQDSVFEVEGLMSAVTVMKAVGIEAMDAVTSSSGQTTQRLLDYASDIAAMFPNMRNAYGTGVNAAMGALKEYIAEGNALSLKRGAGLDIKGILGEEKGATIEERTRQVADLVEMLGIAGYTTSLVGTPTQQLAKIQDILFNTMSDIADSGVFDIYTQLLTKAATWIESLTTDTEKYNAIVSLLGDTITAVLTPLGKLLDYAIKIADAFIDWALEHQTLAKGILIAVAAVGAFLVVGGQILKLSGSFFMLTSSLMQMSNLASNGISIFNVFGRSIGIFASKLLPLVGIGALIYTAWTNNFFGIRDVVTKSFKDIVDTIKLVFDAFADNTLSEENFLKAKEMGILPLIETILDLKYRFDFFKQGFVKGWREISETITGVIMSITNSVSGTIFEPLIEGISEFFSKLSESDPDAWSSVGESVAKFAGLFAVIMPVVDIVVSLASKLKGLSSIITGIFSLVTAHPVIAVIVAIIGALVALYANCEEFRDFVNGLFSSLSEIFNDTLGTIVPMIEESIATLTENLAPLKDAFLSFLPQVGQFFEKIMEFVAQLIAKVIELGVKLLPSIIQVVTTLVSTIMQVLPLVMDVLSTIFSVISDLILPIIMELIDMVIPFIVELVELATELINAVLPVIVGLLQEIIPVITNLIQLIVPMLKNIFDALKPVIQTVMNVVTMIVSRLVPVLKKLFEIVSDIITTVVNILAPIIEVIMQVVEAIVSFLMPIIDVIIQGIGFVIDIILGIVEIVANVIAFIVKIVTSIINVIVGIITTIVRAIMSVVSVIVGIVQTIIDTITSIIGGIISFVQGVWDGIVAVFSGVIDFFAGIFETVYDTVTGIFQGIADFFSDVWDGIVSAFNAIGDTISGAIRGAINGVLSGAVGIINGFINAINFAIGLINAIPGVNISKLNLLEVPQLAEGGVVDKPTPAIIGEAGKEAVVPLENNTEWIDKVANKVAPKLITEQNRSQTSSQEPKEVHNDYSVTFSAGSIVIQLANATDAELERAAEKLMRIIERKQQLKRMAVRT